MIIEILSIPRPLMPLTEPNNTIIVRILLGTPDYFYRLYQ
jgi:hypothetical protein